jgi:hypothetical protein
MIFNALVNNWKIIWSQHTVFWHGCSTYLCAVGPGRVFRPGNTARAKGVVLQGRLASRSCQACVGRHRLRRQWLYRLIDCRVASKIHKPSGIAVGIPIKILEEFCSRLDLTYLHACCDVLTYDKRMTHRWHIKLKILDEIKYFTIERYCKS